HFRRLKDRVLLCRAGNFRWRNIRDGHAIECEYMRSSHVTQFRFTLRQRDVQAGFALFGSLQQELQGSGCLAITGVTLDQVKKTFGQSSMKNVIEPSDPC